MTNVHYHLFFDIPGSGRSQNGVMYRSVIKPTDKAYSEKNINMFTAQIRKISSVEPASEEANTIKVMGGED
jgi:trans-2-enoyl-CoA reductase